VKTWRPLLAGAGDVLVSLPWLIALLYAVELLLSVAIAVVVNQSLASLSEGRPFFDRAWSGDGYALLTFVQHAGTGLWTIAAIAGTAALGYALLSLVFCAGLIDLLAHPMPGQSRWAVLRRFGGTGARLLWPYLRLALWAAVPYTLIGVVALLGLFNQREALVYAVSKGELAGAVALALGPAAALWLVLATALDYARIELAQGAQPRAGRALARALRLVLARPVVLVHAALFALARAAGATAYVMTVGTAATMSGLALLAGRQLWLASNYLLAIARLGGQVRWFGRRT
jgi:hypothetical protein